MHRVKPETEPWWFYNSVKIIAQGLSEFGLRYADLAEKMAVSEGNVRRRKELMKIASICRQVPGKGARTFHEALQSLTLTHIAICNEVADSTICPGRMDQYLYPFYKNDVDTGIFHDEDVKELLSCFSIKLCEHYPVLNESVSRSGSGLPTFQTVTIGGVDEYGRDAVNELSYIFLDVMNELRMREPNFHARVSRNSPKEYIEKIYGILADGSNTPALYNDEVIINAMVEAGYTLTDARDYAPIGCVEPASQGKSLSSTNADLLNMPIALEFALNQGRQFGSRLRFGAKTKPVKDMTSMADVKAAFESQLQHLMNEMITDLQFIEKAHAKYQPTPLSSMLIQGCMTSGKCSTRGGAEYSFSGVQCVGPSDAGDALYAIDKIVFNDQKMSLSELVGLLKNNIPDEKWYVYMRKLEKFGNDIPEVDQWTLYVVEQFVNNLKQKGKNTRGGNYLPGLYSVTNHDFFGSRTGALPNGRRKSESFASGIAPGNGMDKKGTTALLNSMNRFDFTPIANGINFNMKFNALSFKTAEGAKVLNDLVMTYFNRGGMQAQINVLSPEILLKARDNPDAYPNLMIRISGYCAYFNQLTRKMQDEIIMRSNLQG